MRFFKTSTCGGDRLGRALGTPVWLPVAVGPNFVPLCCVCEDREGDGGGSVVLAVPPPAQSLPCIHCLGSSSLCFPMKNENRSFIRNQVMSQHVLTEQLASTSCS